MNIITTRQAAEWLPEDHIPGHAYTIANSVKLEPLFRVTVNGVTLNKILTRQQLEQIDDWNRGAGVFGRVIAKLTQTRVAAYRVDSI